MVPNLPAKIIQIFSARGQAIKPQVYEKFLHHSVNNTKDKCTSKHALFSREEKFYYFVDVVGAC